MRITPWAVAALAATALSSATPAFAADDLAKQFESTNAAERIAAAEALAEQSPSQLRALLPVLTKALEDKQWPVRHAVLSALPRLGPGLKNALPAVEKSLADPEGIVQVEALHVLRRLGPDAASTTPAVTKLLAAQDPYVRVAAALTLERIAAENKPALDQALATLSGLAKTDDPGLRREVVAAFVALGEPALPMLTAALASPDNRTAAVAADAIADLGPLARGATTALIEQVDRPDKNVAVRMIRALGEIGSPAKSAAKTLIAKTGDDSPLVRAHVARTLGRLGDESATDALLALTKDKDASVARTALAALGELHPDPKDLSEAEIKTLMPALLAAVENPDPQIRGRAMGGLSRLGSAAAPVLIEALNDPNRRHAATVALAEIGPEAKAAAAPLGAAATDEDPATRMQAFMALAAIGPDAKPAAAAIVKGLDDPQPSVRYAAAFAAGRLSEDADKATTAKLETLAAQDKDPFLQTVATWALAKINPEDDKRTAAAVTLLAKGLTSKEPRQRSASMLGLMELKPRPEILVPAVLTALKDVDPKEAPNVVAALAEFGPLPAPLLLGADQPALRQNILIVLARQKAAPALVVPALTAAIVATEKDQDDRGELLLALANYGEDAKGAVEPIRKILTDDTQSLSVRRRAAYVLGKIGKEAWSAQTDLESLLASDESGLRVAAAWALVLVAPKSPESVQKATPVLVEGLADERAAVKAELASALGSLGPAAASAVPVLRKLATDADPEIARAATEALEKIQP